MSDAAAAKSIAARASATEAPHPQLVDAQRGRASGHECPDQLTLRVKELADRGHAQQALAPMIGRSSQWQSVLAQALRVAPTDATVFLRGESGTGKEVVARLIHQASPRKQGPFVAINCAALPEQLLEAELFGYERGAFTGAQHSKPGKIELAARGVLFLDEVSEMSRAAQAKLLRFLQEREFTRLGGTRLQMAQVRVIAASNRDLRQAVQQGHFREDLFYRLQVFDIELPPLRERIGDVPLFADRFVEEFGRALGRPLSRLTEEARDALLAHDWPGNVRELRNAIERAVILSDGDAIEPQHFSLQVLTAQERQPNYLPAMERRTIARVLHETDGNKAKAARRLGITRTQLYVRLRKYGLEMQPPCHL